MSKLNRNALRKMILKEFKMLDMKPMGGEMLGHSPFEDHDHDMEDHNMEGHDMMDDMTHGGKAYSGGHAGSVSKEDCCKAVLCLIECCNCPETKALLQECCEDILSRC